MHLMKRLLQRGKRPLVVLLAAPLLSAAESARAIVIVADSRKFTGVRAWWANLYNESHFHFALMTIILIPLVGIILGLLADFAMARLGIDLRSRALREG